MTTRLPDDDPLQRAEDDALGEQIPAFDLNDMGDAEHDAAAFDVEHQQEVEAEQLGNATGGKKPKVSKRTIVILAVAAAAIGVAAIGARRGKPAPPNPDMARIQMEAGSIPATDVPRMTGNTAAPLAPSSSATAGANPAPAGSQALAGGIKSVPTVAPVTASAPAAASSAKAAPAAAATAATGAAPATVATTSAAPAPAPATAASTHAPAAAAPDATAEKLAAAERARDEAIANADDLRGQLATAKKALAAAGKPEVKTVTVPSVASITVQAVLSDGVVLKDGTGKTLVAPNGAVVAIDGKHARIK